jgi:Phage major capsid protein E
MDLVKLVNDMARDGYFTRIASDRRAQFGLPRRRYLGATILPERRVQENAYREDAIRYRTVIANDGSRYSPAQKKSSGQLVGSMLVELGNQDIAQELTGQDYDALIRFLETNASMEAVAAVINWTEVTVNRALVELMEKQRWQALVDGQVIREGDNGYREVVTYPTVAGMRVTAGGTWSDDTYDPWDEITGMADAFFDTGHDVTRIITSRRVVSILSRNAKIAARASGNIRVLSNSDVIGRTSAQDINRALGADNLPAIEQYDLRWRDENTTGRFLPDDAMVFLSSTGQDQTVDWGDNQRFLSDVLGYHALGRPVGEPRPGRVIRMWPKDNKPPRLEAVRVIRGIN